MCIRDRLTCCATGQRQYTIAKIIRLLELTHLPHFSHLLIIGILAAVISASVQARETCTVDHCHDGDTCTLVCAGERVKVRLHCIDAPEMSQAPWGANSRDYLRQHARTGAAVELVSITRDKYRRTVGVLLLDGVNLNLNQVHAGWAVALSLIHI